MDGSAIPTVPAHAVQHSNLEAPLAQHRCCIITDALRPTLVARVREAAADAFALPKPQRMEYRSVGHRCAVDLDALRLPIPPTEAMAILATLRVRILAVDIVALARGCIGSTVYRRGAHPREAPGVADCSSLVKWLYGQRGVWLPRRAIQQRAYGEPVPYSSIRACDIVFASGRIDRYDHDPADGVGHVGIAMDAGTVVHAASTRAGVIASPLDRFAPPDKFRGARRYLPHDRTIHTLEIPDALCVEMADDIRWIILGHLPHASH